MVVAINVRNRHASNSSSLTSIATRISTKVNTKVRSLVTKFEFLGRKSLEASKVQSPTQPPLSKQRRSTIASIKQPPAHDAATPPSYANPTMGEVEGDPPVPAEGACVDINLEKHGEDLLMRAEVAHVFNNDQAADRPKKSAVQRCASMFDRLAKDRTMAFEGRVSQVHIYAPCVVEQKPFPRPLEKPKDIAKGKGGMLGGVKALIKVFNRQQPAKYNGCVDNGKKSSRRNCKSVTYGGGIDCTTFDSSSSIASTRAEYYPTSRFDSVSSLAARSANQSCLRYKSHHRPRHPHHDSSAYLSKTPTPYEDYLPIVKVRDLCPPSTNGQRKSPLRSVSKPKVHRVSTRSLASMLVRVRGKQVLTPIENQNNQDPKYCTKCKPGQYWSCPGAGPSNPASPAASTTASSYELPILKVRRTSFGNISFKGFSFGDLSFEDQDPSSTNPSSSSSPALTPVSAHPRRKGTPLPENYLLARRNSQERFNRQLEVVRAEFPKEDLNDWQAALRIVTESDDSFYDESSDEVESVNGKKVTKRSADEKEKEGAAGADERVCDEKVLTASPCQRSSGRDASLPSLSLLHPHYEPLASLTPDDNGSNKYHSLLGTIGSREPAEETCGDMPLGEFVQLLGRSDGLDQSTRVRIPVRGLPAGEVESPRPHMYRGATRNIRRLIGRWS
ncbi:MAG: hypothetical protein M1840_005502 [Geoglossum simile]|nr:MAG: hypothetical protein M1840_005502 [Geoglossum simile]